MISIEAYRVSIGSFLTKARVTSASSQQLLQQDYDYFAKRFKAANDTDLFFEAVHVCCFYFGNVSQLKHVFFKVKNPS